MIMQISKQCTYQEYAEFAHQCNMQGLTIINHDSFWEGVKVESSLEELKQRKLQEVGLEFANRRDAIRWVGEYGFDCTVEDITNFMAAFTPLLVEKSGNVYYKVWLEEQKKGIVQLSYEQMQAVYDAVRAGQLEAYAWYETIKARTLACETKEDLEAITW